ncbi:stAR-related lipid transfer protein 9, partial [Trichinella spiralis]|uniref:stAR-related lipid transfer protein 9 n=2 Tax=Trichinella spiralis TaxID=6334 RepID=UPI0001EFC6E7
MWAFDSVVSFDAMFCTALHNEHENVNSRKPFPWFSKSAINYNMVLLIAANNIAVVINAVMHKRKRKAIASEIGQFFIEILCFSYVNVYHSRIVHILAT